MDTVSLAHMFKSLFDALIREKHDLQNELHYREQKDQSEYEQQLIKLEAEVRQHISIEQQLKLYLENSQQKLEESERQIAMLKSQIAQQVESDKENSRMLANAKKVHTLQDENENSIIRKKGVKKNNSNTRYQTNGGNTNYFQKTKQADKSMTLEDIKRLIQSLSK